MCRHTHALVKHISIHPRPSTTLTVWASRWDYFRLISLFFDIPSSPPSSLLAGSLCHLFLQFLNFKVLYKRSVLRQQQSAVKKQSCASSRCNINSWGADKARRVSAVEMNQTNRLWLINEFSSITNPRPVCFWLFRSVQKVYSGWKPIKLQQVELWCQLTLIIFSWPATLFLFLLISFTSINHCTPPRPHPVPAPFATNPTINLIRDPQHKSPMQFSSPSISTASFLWEQRSSHHNFLSSFSISFPSSFHILLPCFSFLSSCLLAPLGIT